MSSPVSVGDIIAGKYQVERVLGVGGMGVVVAAKHKTLGERYAIKFLLPQALARADVVKRFRQEAQAAARLRSEHVARVYDDGELPGGEPYLVMEYLDGRDLGAVLRDEGPMPVERAVEYVMQACEALAEAHAAGIIHRDLKPSNLFRIKRLDGSPSIKLIDFGISKVSVPGAEGAEGEMTATAVMMGSPLYMAPEQMASARDVDARADIWSLGIILHALLTGGPPFRAPTVMGVYELIVQGPPSVRKARAEVPEGLEAVIHKCLQRDRKLRYADVGELAEALAAFGPPEAKIEVSRIKRIIVARSTAASIAPPTDTPAPALALTPPTPSPSGAGEKGGPEMPAESKPTASSDIASRAGASSQSTGSSLPIDPQGTNGPWDQRTHPPTSRRPKAAVIASIAAVLIGAPLAFFALRSTSAPRATTGSDPTAKPIVTASASAPAAPETAKPSVLPGATVAPTAASASASQAPVAPPTPSATVAAPRGPSGVATPPRTPPKARSDGDLFGTQK